MKRFVPLLLAASAVVAALSAAASPLKRADLSADPAWALHVDCDALRQTYLGQYLLDQVNKGEFNSQMASFQIVHGFDLRTRLHGLTIYSDGETPRDNVLIIYADFNAEQVIELAQAAEGADSAETDHHTIYSWIDQVKKSGESAGHRSFAAFEKGRMIVTRNRETLVEALAVIDGTTPNLAASKALPELGNKSGTAFLQGAARKMDFLETAPNAALLKMSRRIKLQAREANQQFNAVLTFDLSDPDTAAQMSIVAQGLIAMLALQNGNPNAARVASGISIKHDQGTLTTTLSIPSTDLVAALKPLLDKSTRPKPALQPAASPGRAQ